MNYVHFYARGWRSYVSRESRETATFENWKIPQGIWLLLMFCFKFTAQSRILAHHFTRILWNRVNFILLGQYHTLLLLCMLERNQVQKIAFFGYFIQWTASYESCSCQSFEQPRRACSKNVGIWNCAHTYSLSVKLHILHERKNRKVKISWKLQYKSDKYAA